MERNVLRMPLASISLLQVAPGKLSSTPSVFHAELMAAGCLSCSDCKPQHPKQKHRSGTIVTIVKSNFMKYILRPRETTKKSRCSNADRPLLCTLVYSRFGQACSPFKSKKSYRKHEKIKFLLQQKGVATLPKERVKI